jgi:hypothetical protein
VLLVLLVLRRRECWMFVGEAWCRKVILSPSGGLRQLHSDVVRGSRVSFSSGQVRGTRRRRKIFLARFYYVFGPNSGKIRTVWR